MWCMSLGSCARLTSLSWRLTNLLLWQLDGSCICSFALGLFCLLCWQTLQKWWVDPFLQVPLQSSQEFFTFNLGGGSTMRNLRTVLLNHEFAWIGHGRASDSETGMTSTWRSWLLPYTYLYVLVPEVTGH